MSRLAQRQHCKPGWRFDLGLGGKDEREGSDVESDVLLEDKVCAEKSPLPFSRGQWWFMTATAINLVVLLVNISLLLGSSFAPWQEKNSALRATSAWSPILDDVEITQFSTFINGTLMPLPEVSIARETPSVANDAHWDIFNNVLTHVVTREDIIRLGKDPDKVAKFEDEFWGLGDDAYMVQLDVMHQIHCLDVLRKAAFADYPGYSAEPEARDKMWWMHLGHCTDLILQNMQCNANTEVLTLAWVEGRRQPWPDFSIQRTCRSFDTIVKWQHENAVDAEKFDRVVAPKDAFVWPAPWKAGAESELGVKLGQHHEQEGI